MRPTKNWNVVRFPSATSWEPYQNTRAMTQYDKTCVMEKSALE